MSNNKFSVFDNCVLAVVASPYIEFKMPTLAQLAEMDSEEDSDFAPEDLSDNEDQIANLEGDSDDEGAIKKPTKATKPKKPKKSDLAPLPVRGMPPRKRQKLASSNVVGDEDDDMLFAATVPKKECQDSQQIDVTTGSEVTTIETPSITNSIDEPPKKKQSLQQLVASLQKPAAKRGPITFMPTRPKRAEPQSDAAATSLSSTSGTIAPAVVQIKEFRAFAGQTVEVVHTVVKGTNEERELRAAKCVSSLIAFHSCSACRAKRGDLDQVLAAIQQKNALSTVEKSKLDWQKDKAEVGDTDELRKANTDGFVLLFLFESNFDVFLCLLKYNNADISNKWHLSLVPKIDRATCSVRFEVRDSRIYGRKIQQDPVEEVICCERIVSVNREVTTTTTKTNGIFGEQRKNSGLLV